MLPLNRILLSTLLIFVLTASAFANNINDARAVKGIIDLRQNDLKKEIPLTGEWKFERSLIASDSVDRINNYIKVPSLWPHEFASSGYATYSLKILLPKDHAALALEIPDVYSSLKVFVNGRMFFQSGTPATQKENAAPHWETNTLPINDSADTVDLVLHVANFWHSKGGVNENFIIGEKEELLLKRERTEAFDLLLTGCLFMGGLFFFGLYLFGKHDRAILFFSLFCMVYSYRIIGTDSYTLHSIFPSLSWFFTTRLEYLTLYLSIGLFVQYTNSLYPEDVNKKIITAMTLFCFVFALSVLFPPVFFTKLINSFLVVMFAYIGYAFYVYVIAMQKKRIGSLYALISTAVVLVVFGLINLSYFQIIPSMKGVVFFGYIAFFFLQSLILSYRFATTLKIAKQQAEEGLQAKSSFLSTISHEIRTPLNSVIGTAHIMLKNEPRDDQKQQLDILLFSANNLLGLVNDVLDFNKIEANKTYFESIPMNIGEITEKVVASLRPLAGQKNIDIVENIDKNISTTLGDPMRLSQVLTNLIHNAVKFTETGTVVVSVKKINETDDRISVQFEVVDTGIGIPADKQTLIFDQFTQADSSTSRSFGGTGLGLAITKKIIEQQGSYLFLKSVPGEGSTFYFTLEFEKAPHIQPEKPPSMKSDSETKQLPLSGVQILLVEDNALNIFVAQSFLEQWGATIDVAENGQIAVDMIDPQKHQIVLMDMHMPIMDGYEAVEMIRGKGIQTPIIALTASISKESESRVMKVGANGIIVKPFDPDSLLAVVKKFVGR